MRPCFAFRAKKLLHTGVRTGRHYLISLPVCLSMCVCATFVVLTDFESCTSWNHTNPGYMETGEYELTNTWDVLRCTPSRGDRGRRAAVDFLVGFRCGRISLFVDLFFFEERTRPAASM